MATTTKKNTLPDYQKIYQAATLAANGVTDAVTKNTTTAPTNTQTPTSVSDQYYCEYPKPTTQTTVPSQPVKTPTVSTPTVSTPVTATNNYLEQYLNMLGSGGSNDYLNQYLNALSAGGSNDYLNLALEALGQQNMPAYKAGTYESKYGTQLDALLNEILASSYQGYDAANDPIFGQYKKQYLRDADRTTEDVLGQYAALTGGLPSTAAVSAASQAGNYYKGQLADKIPELAQLDYQNYLTELANKRSNLSDLLSLENYNYGQWADGEDRRYNEYATNYAANQDYLNQLVTAAGLEQDQNNSRLDQLYKAAGLEQDQNSNYLNQLYQAAQLKQSEIDSEYSRTLAENETAYNRTMALISSGIMPSESDLAAAGIDSSTAQALMEAATSSGLSEDAMMKLLELSVGNGTTPSEAVLDYFGLTDNWASGVVDNTVAKENGTDLSAKFGGTITDAEASYFNAVSYANQNGVTDTSDLMTEEAWSKNKGGYSSYLDYVTDYVAQKQEDARKAEIEKVIEKISELPKKLFNR